MIVEEDDRRVDHHLIVGVPGGAGNILRVQVVATRRVVEIDVIRIPTITVIDILRGDIGGVVVAVEVPVGIDDKSIVDLHPSNQESRTSINTHINQ